MSAARQLGAIAPLISKKVFDTSHLDSTSVIFRLHSKVTPAFLFGASILLSVSQYFGNPIDCITSLPKNAINSYCWITSTFTMPDYYYRDAGGIHPGVHSPRGYDEEEAQRNWRFHNYYQWIVFILFFMGALCYLPNYIWKKLEGKWLNSLSQKLPSSLMSMEDLQTKNQAIADHLLNRSEMMNGYFYKYCICEMICFFNLLFQMIMLDTVFQGEFFSYGAKVWDFSDMDQEQRVDPMIYIFPRMTKCHFHLFGPSGTIKRGDALCLLAQNIVNEKVFIFVWFWYIILMIKLSVLFVYRVCLYLSPWLRVKVIAWQNKMFPEDKLQVIVYQKSIGFWWNLNLLSRTYESVAFKDIINKIFDEVESKNSNGISNSPYIAPSAPYSCSATSVV